MGFPELDRLIELMEGGFSRIAQQHSEIESRLAGIAKRIDRLEGAPVGDRMESRSVTEQIVGIHQAIRSEGEANRKELRWIVQLLVGVLIPIFVGIAGLLWALRGQMSSLDTTVGSLNNTVSQLSASVTKLDDSVDALAQRVSYGEGARSTPRPQPAQGE